MYTQLLKTDQHGQQPFPISVVTAFIRRTANALMRLGGCTGWFVIGLGVLIVSGCKVVIEPDHKTTIPIKGYFTLRKHAHATYV